MALQFVLLIACALVVCCGYLLIFSVHYVYSLRQLESWIISKENGVKPNFPFFLVALLVLRLSLGFAAALMCCCPDSDREIRKDREMAIERKGQKEQ